MASLSERVGAAAGPISLMALLAAIIVITNTVLVSVTQRTREIGVRRALGAPRQQIIREVLAESALVALAGLVLLRRWTRTREDAATAIVLGVSFGLG